LNVVAVLPYHQKEHTRRKNTGKKMFSVFDKKSDFCWLWLNTRKYKDYKPPQQKVKSRVL